MVVSALLAASAVPAPQTYKGQPTVTSGTAVLKDSAFSDPGLLIATHDGQREARFMHVSLV